MGDEVLKLPSVPRDSSAWYHRESTRASGAISVLGGLRVAPTRT